MTCAWCGNDLDLTKKHLGSPDTDEEVHSGACGEEFRNNRGLDKLRNVNGVAVESK